MATRGTGSPLEGGRDCGDVRYAMEVKPMIVHYCQYVGCHVAICPLLKSHSCRWCQRETGASFALNAMIETDRLKVLGGEPEWTTVTSASGAGQSVARCPTCSIAVWSVYLHGTANIRQRIRIVRAGTLDTPDLLPPDVHIWTSETQPWIVLSDAN
jgi:hypothetical protein